MTQSPAQRRLARTVAAAAASPPVCLLATTISVVTPGGADNGDAAVSFADGADNIPAPYLSSYLSPAVGDQVAVLLIDHSPLILGRVTGQTTY